METSLYRKQIETLHKKGWLTLITLLLTEGIIVLWGIFLILFAFETLIPTIGVTRFSLTTYLFWLLMGTFITLWLRRETTLTAFEMPRFFWHPIHIALGLFILSLITLSLIHFSLIGGILFFFLYGGLGWFLWQYSIKK